MRGIFNAYIRLRDAEPKTGLVTCVTCGKRLHYTQAYSGHYIHNDWSESTFYEFNVNPQCCSCNVNVHQAERITNVYKKYIIKKYGYNILRTIRRKSLKKLPDTKETRLKRALDYKLKVYNLLVEKRLPPSLTIVRILNQNFFKKYNLKPLWRDTNAAHQP